MAGDHEGQRVSRRFLVAGIAAVGFGGVLAACGRDSSDSGSTDDPNALFTGVPTCGLAESATQGPYYFDADRVRGDIREDRPGTRLRLAFKVVESEECKPLQDAVVEVWHCDADGVYSGAESLSTGGGGEGGPSGGPSRGGRPGSDGAPVVPPVGSGGPGMPPSGGGSGGGAADLTPTDDKRYLRGAQVTDSDGIVQFVTIWPGWYRGRTVHAHVVVHVSDNRALTTQLMFDETLNAQVFALSPYDSRTGRDTFNGTDSIYRPSMLTTVTRDGDGFIGAIVLGVDVDKDGR